MKQVRINITADKADRLALQRLALTVLGDFNASRLVRLIAANADDPRLKEVLQRLVVESEGNGR